MSVHAYVGLPGAGKTYDAVANVIIPALEKNLRVVTNIPLNRDEIRKVHRGGEIVEFPIDVIAQEPHKVDEYASPGCVLVIDEAWRLWPAGEKTNKVPQPFKSLLAEHRHRVDSQGNAMNVVLVTQDLAQVAAFARQLVETTFHHTKLSHMGSSGTFRVDIFHGAVTGAVPPVNNRTREIFRRYSPKIWRFYKSHTMSNREKGGANEKPMDTRANFFKRWQFWAIGAAAIAVGIWGMTAMASLVSRYGGGGTSEASSPAPDPQPTQARFSVQSFESPPPSRAPASVLPRRERAQYELVGFIENVDNEDASLAVISDGKHTLSLPLTACEPSGFASYTCRYRDYSIDVFGSY